MDGIYDTEIKVNKMIRSLRRFVLVHIDLVRCGMATAMRRSRVIVTSTQTENVKAVYPRWPPILHPISLCASTNTGICSLLNNTLNHTVKVALYNESVSEIASMIRRKAVVVFFNEGRENTIIVKQLQTEPTTSNMGGAMRSMVSAILDRVVLMIIECCFSMYISLMAFGTLHNLTGQYSACFDSKSV